MLFRLTVIILQLFLHFCAIHATRGGLLITLSIFSGRRRNPEWSVPETDPLYESIVKHLATHDQSRSESLPARLGFRGFIVKEKRKTPVNVGSNTAPRELQELLLNTMPPKLIKKRNYDEVSKAITGSQGRAVKGKAKRYVPPYNPDPWSATAFIQRCNNCYNYANIVMTNNKAEPGSGSGQAYENCTAEEVQDASIRDGLLLLDPQPGDNDPVPGDPGGNRHLVALVVAPDGDDYDGDFHWYRLDNDGKWSHKPGETAVTRLDNGDNEITDPRRASMARYQFVSFMTSDRDTVQLQDDYQCQ